MPVTNSHANNFFSCFSSSIAGTVTPTPQQLKEEQKRLMKKSRCFSYKERGHTAYDCPEKEKIAAILGCVSEDNNSQGKE